MMIKYIAIDLDGTLLNDDSNINMKSLNALKLLREEKFFIICTGRKIYEISYVLDFFRLRKGDFIICNDGQLVYDFNKNYIFETGFIKKQQIDFLIKNIKTKCIYLFSQNYDYYFFTKKIFYAYNFLKFILNKKVIIINKLSHIAEDNKIYKIKICSKKDSQLESKIENIFSVHYIEEKEEYEFLDIKCNKYESLKILNDNKLIDIEELIYFGNDINDIECFEKLKYSVAMGNSSSIIKNKATFVTKSNNNGGIAAALRKMKLI